MKEPAILAEALTKDFGPIHALSGIDLRLEKGEFLTILGPNGAGKTTLIKILATLMRPTSGLVRVAGYDLAEAGEALRRRIGVISHQTYLYENLTAYENLRFYGRMYGVQDLEGRINQVMEEVGLKGRRDHLVRTYSRGMQQRLSIARALIHDPSVLLLDEPYTGLDQHATRMLTGLLAGLRDGERTVILTTHQLSQGLELSDFVAILVRGRIVYQEKVAGLSLADLEDAYFQHVGQEYRWDTQ